MAWRRMPEQPLPPLIAINLWAVALSRPLSFSVQSLFVCPASLAFKFAGIEQIYKAQIEAGRLDALAEDRGSDSEASYNYSCAVKTLKIELVVEIAVRNWGPPGPMPDLFLSLFVFQLLLLVFSCLYRISLSLFHFLLFSSSSFLHAAFILRSPNNFCIG